MESKLDQLAFWIVMGILAIAIFLTPAKGATDRMEATLDYFLPYQLDWINDQSPVSFGEKSRRIGWTYAESYRAVERRVRGVSNLYFSSADMTAAREFVDYCQTWARVFNVVAQASDQVEVIDEREMHTKVLTFDNGKKIVAGPSNPTFFRSKGGDADADEFAFHRDGRELFKAMHATALFWGHPLRMWSTHNGPSSYFNQMIQQAKGGKLKARLHKVTILDAVDQGIVEKIRGLKVRDDKARQEWLDELKATCPDDDVWNEEYLCIPASDASSLLSYDLINACTQPELKLVYSPNDLPREAGAFYAGYDVGRRHDFSVLWLAERVGDVLVTRMLRCLDRQSFATQESLLVGLMSNSRVRRLCIDESGIGAQLAERMMTRFRSRVEGVTLSGPVKATLGMTFRDRFTDRQIRIPENVDWDAFDGSDPINRIVNRRNLKARTLKDGWLKEDLHKTQKDVTASGNVRLAAESDSDGHADGFWAGALMNEAASGVRTPPMRSEQYKPFGL